MLSKEWLARKGNRNRESEAIKNDWILSLPSSWERIAVTPRTHTFEPPRKPSPTNHTQPKNTSIHQNAGPNWFDLARQGHRKTKTKKDIWSNTPRMDGLVLWKGCILIVAMEEDLDGPWPERPGCCCSSWTIEGQD